MDWSLVAIQAPMSLLGVWFVAAWLCRFVGRHRDQRRTEARLRVERQQYCPHFLTVTRDKCPHCSGLLPNGATEPRPPSAKPSATDGSTRGR